MTDNYAQIQVTLASRSDMLNLKSQLDSISLAGINVMSLAFDSKSNVATISCGGKNTLGFLSNVKSAIASVTKVPSPSEVTIAAGIACATPDDAHQGIK